MAAGLSVAGWGLLDDVKPLHWRRRIIAARSGVAGVGSVDRRSPPCLQRAQSKGPESREEEKKKNVAEAGVRTKTL
jgi:hypothetical protein